MKPLLRPLRGGWLAVGLIVFAAAAAGSCADFLNALARRESNMDQHARNPYGYVGLWQMGEAALVDAGYYRADGTGRNDWRGSWTGHNGINSLNDFLNNAAAQAQAVAAYHQRVWGYIRAQGLDTYVGRTVGGMPITQSGLIAAAHLVGTGSLATFLRSDGRTVPRDGNRTPVTEYLTRFGGYAITGADANCADFANGHPTGGIVATQPSPSAPVPGPSPTRVVADSSAAPTRNVDEAYYMMTGHSAGEASQLIRLIIGTLLMIAVTACWLGSWGLLSTGVIDRYRFFLDNKRLLVVTLMFLLVLA